MKRTPLRYDPDNPRKTVEALIAGMPVARVPEDEHSALLMKLSAALTEAQVARNEIRSKRIREVMKKLRLHPGKTPEQIRTQSRELATADRGRVWGASEDDDVIIDELIDGRPPESVDGGRLGTLLPKLKERQKTTIDMGDYRTSQKLEDLIVRMNARSLVLSNDEDRNQRLATLRVQLMNAKQELKNAQDFWRDHIDEYNQIYNDSKANLDEVHRQQLEDFDASFPEMLPTNFRKMSAHVLQVREQEKHLVLAHRFEEAIPLHERADQLEKEELEIQRQKFIKAFHTQRQQLLDVQSSQNDCFDKNRLRKWKQIEQERNKELASKQQFVAHLEKRIEKLEAADIEPVVVENSRPATRTRSGMRSRSVNVGRARITCPRVGSRAASRFTGTGNVCRF